jgi:hypothetical protein
VSYFHAKADHYRVVNTIRDRIVFATHNLLRDPPVSRQHLVSCRNLLIYLDRELQEQAMTVFRYACRDKAYLFLGASELADEGQFRAIDKKHRIFATRERGECVRAPLPEILTAPSGPAVRQGRETRQVTRPTMSEVHITALEEIGPPSLLVDERWNVLHLSASGRRRPAAGYRLAKIENSCAARLRARVSRSVRIYWRRRRIGAGSGATHTVCIEDVTRDCDFAPYREIAARAGFRAVQSEPLIGKGGELVGVMSIHFREPHAFSERDRRLGAMVTRPTADLIVNRTQQENVAQLNETLSRRTAELEAIQVQLSRQAAELLRNDRNKEAFLAALGHELRNPMAAIQHSLELISATDEPSQTAVTVLRRQTRHGVVRAVSANGRRPAHGWIGPGSFRW